MSDPLISEEILTTEQLQAIGCLTVEASRLSLVIRKIVQHFVRDAFVADALLEGKMLTPQVECLRKLLASRASSAASEELRLLCNDIKSDLKKRNAVAHGAWEEPAVVGDWLAYFDQFDPSRDALVTHKQTEIRASDVMALARRFAAHQLNLALWYAELVGSPGASPGR